MATEWFLVILTSGASNRGRQRVRRRLEQLGGVFQIELKDGFVVRLDRDRASAVRTWKEVRLIGGVHPRRKEVPRIRPHVPRSD